MDLHLRWPQDDILEQMPWALIYRPRDNRQLSWHVAMAICSILRVRIQDVLHPKQCLTAWPNYHWILYSTSSKVIGYTSVCLDLNSMSKFLALNLKIAAVSASCIYPSDTIWKLCLSKTLLLRFFDQKCFEFQIPREWKIECWLLLIRSMWKFWVLQGWIYSHS